jgi:PAS domain S-box-containing protein
VHEGLVALIREIALRPSLQEVLQIAVLHMSKLFAVDRVSVVLFGSGNDVGFVVKERDQAALDNIVIRIDDYPELKEIIQSKQPLVIPDVFGETLLEGVRSKLTHAEHPHRAAVLFPLLRRDQVVGALFLRHRTFLGNLTDRLLTMGRLVASVTAVAIGHAIERDTLMSEHRALQRSEAHALEQLEGLKEMREFLDQAKDGMVVTDAAGVIRYANASAGAILLAEPTQLVGKRFLELLVSQYRALGERALAGQAVGDENGYVDLVVADDAGEDAVVISAAIRNLATPQGVFISFRDVTALREIESELRQTKEFLENLIQSSVDAIIATDTDGQVILFNRAAEQILGYEAREVVGRINVSALYPAGEAWDVMRKLRSEAYGGRGRLQLVRKELVAKGGEVVPVNLTAAIIYEGGREVATVSIFSDLRERKRIEEKLTQVQRKLQLSERQAVAVELAGAAAHELNQPLTSILGYAELLRKRIPDGDVSKKGIETILRETERMATIVKRIGQITAYQTKPYVGSSQIIDISGGGDGPPPKEGDS